MKLLLKTSLPLFFFANAFAQEMPNVEVKPVEYVWERKAGDNRIVFAKDSIYQEILKRSFSNAIADKWNTGPVAFEVKVNKLPVLRSQPKFNTSVSNADSAKHYIFLQLFDKSVPVNFHNLLFTARIEVRYKLIKAGVAQEDKITSYKIMQRIPAPGQIIIDRYPFHSSQFKFLCDTIASAILDEDVKNEREIWLEPACAFTEEIIQQHLDSNNFQFGTTRQSISVSGDNGFNIVHDSVKVVQTGKKKHAAGNTVSGLLTFFSNIDTEKKRSTLHTADHSFSDGSAAFHAYVRYIDTKVAERRRVKDEEGYKSIEVGEYQPAWKEINPNEKHVITMNGDTVSSFNIQFRLVEDHFIKMWDGKDVATIDSLPFAFNNPGAFEMEMKGTIGDDRFALVTSGEGQIKKISLNDEHLFSFYSNYGADGILSYRNLNEHQLKIATLLCLLSDKYYQYK